MNLGRIVQSLSLGNQPIKVYRSSGSMVGGRWVEAPHSPPYFEMRGIIYPSSEKELKQVPGGDRIAGAITFITTEEILVTRVGNSPGLSDKVEWHGDLYKIISILPWSDYGYYMSIGERIKGA